MSYSAAVVVADEQRDDVGVLDVEVFGEVVVQLDRRGEQLVVGGAERPVSLADAAGGIQPSLEDVIEHPVVGIQPGEHRPRADASPGEVGEQVVIFCMVVLEQLVGEPSGPPPQGGASGPVGLGGALDGTDVAGTVGTQLGVDLEVEAEVGCGFHAPIVDKADWRRIEGDQSRRRTSSTAARHGAESIDSAIRAACASDSRAMLTSPRSRSLRATARAMGPSTRPPDPAMAMWSCSGRSTSTWAAAKPASPMRAAASRAAHSNGARYQSSA